MTVHGETYRQKLYCSLDWESLYENRWFRRLCHSLKLNLTQSPAYLVSLIPPEWQISCGLRIFRTYTQSRVRTDRLSSSYFYNAHHEWSLLPIETQASISIAAFKWKFALVIRPIRNPTYGVLDLKGVKNISKLRVQFSCLYAHKIHRNFECIISLRSCGKANEDNDNCLLRCSTLLNCIGISF